MLQIHPIDSRPRARRARPGLPLGEDLRAAYGALKALPVPDSIRRLLAPGPAEGETHDGAGQGHVRGGGGGRG